MQKEITLHMICFLFVFLALLNTSCLKDVYRPDASKNDKPGTGGATVSNRELLDVNQPLPDLSVPATFDWSKVTLRIPLTTEVDIEKIDIKLPPLKYNKQFVYSYTIDDCPINAFSRVFSLINNWWMDDDLNYHYRHKKGEGYYTRRTLGYTDGCGGERRFPFGVAIWPNMGNTQIDKFMHPTNRDFWARNYPYCIWSDITPILDFGGAIYFHDVPHAENPTASEIVQGLKDAQAATSQKIHRKIKTLARANGEDIYVEAGKLYDDVHFMTGGGTASDGLPQYISFIQPVDLQNKMGSRQIIDDKEWLAAEGLKIVEATAQSDAFLWQHDFSHGGNDFQHFMNWLVQLNNRYGKDGKDNVWFATLDEIYEYNYLRKHLRIDKRIDGSHLTISFALPTPSGIEFLPDALFYHRDFSLLIKGEGVQIEEAMVETGSNVYGFSAAYQAKAESWLVNVNCNAYLLERAERYTSKYESHEYELKDAATVKADAKYFIQLLKPELQIQFLKRCQ